MENMEMERVSTKVAAKELNIAVDSLQLLMQMKMLPIGFAYKKARKSRYSYVIYRNSLDEFKKKLAKGEVTLGYETH